MEDKYCIYGSCGNLDDIYLCDICSIDVKSQCDIYCLLQTESEDNYESDN